MSKKKIPQRSKECQVNNCFRKCHAKDLCLRHYRQMEKNGLISGNPQKLKYGELNRHKIVGSICKIELYDVDGFVKGHVIIDKEDYKKVKHIKWSMDGYGYVTNSRRNKKNIKLHQFIMGEKNIDHRSGDLLDNRKNNLRGCSHQENIFNSRVLGKNNTSGYKGVSLGRSGEKWIAQIKINYKNIYLGLFSDKIDAAMAYNNAAVKYFGEFAKINPV